MNTGSEAEMKITDVNGRQLLEKTIQTGIQKIELNSSIENGIYFIYLRNTENGIVSVKKLIIQK